MLVRVLLILITPVKLKSSCSTMERKDFEIKKGDRIAQLVLERCETPPIEEINIVEDTERGSGGFGSTGL
jgi:dUTPase